MKEPTMTTTLLDGRRFDGIVLERGKTSGDVDTLIFEGGRFRSTACTTADYIGDVAFTAETESPQYGTLRWHGVVRGARLDATLTILREGRVTGEKWVLAGER